jgi:hypothetical protein
VRLGLEQELVISFVSEDGHLAELTQTDRHVLATLP